MPNDGGLKVHPFALILAGLLYIEQLMFGANSRNLSLSFAIAQLVVFAVLALTARINQPPPRTAAILFGVVLALGLFSILPLGPPLAHPMWAYVPGAPASISLDPVSTRVELIKLMGLGAMFMMGASLGGDRESGERFVLYLALGGILYCGWAFIASVLTPATIFGVPRAYGVGRLSGSFLSANSAGTLFACLSVIALMTLLRPVTRSRESGERGRLGEWVALWPYGLLLLLALSCLLLSASRGALLSFLAAALCGLGYLAWIKSSRQSLTGGFAVVVCLLAGAAVAVFLVSGDQTASRLAKVDPLNNDRLQLFAAFWPTYLKAPLLGYGLGAFRAFNYASMTIGNSLALSPLGAVHNVYLQWLLQEGAPGAAAMFGCVGMVLAAILRGVARRSSQQTLGVACLATAVVFAVHGMVDFALEEPSLAAFFAAMLGLGYGIAQRPAGRPRGRV